jgi:imidazolonepropionase-like amidohydrolase
VLPGADERDVYVVDGHISFEEPAGGAQTVFESGWLIPGLVDAHAHLPLHSPAGDEAPAADRVRASARAQLDAGVLLVREPGAPDRTTLAVAGEDGMPVIQAAGCFLAPPGRYFPGLAREVHAADLADAVTAEATASGAWVKIVGDFFEPGGQIEPNWEPADLRRAADAAHAAGARIAIHATCSPTIAMAVEAGFDSIEHGHGLSDELLAVMAAQGTAFTPTMSIAPLLRGLLQQLSPEGHAASIATLDDQPRIVRAAAQAGVTVLAGTDAGMLPHGAVAGEIGLLLEAGLSPDVALAAGSWAARAYLNQLGIEEGASADIVAFTDDPRTDAAILTRPVLRMLHGRILS